MPKKVVVFIIGHYCITMMMMMIMIMIKTSQVMST